VSMRTFTLRRLQFVQPFRDFVCVRRMGGLSWKPTGPEVGNRGFFFRNRRGFTAIPRKAADFAVSVAQPHYVALAFVAAVLFEMTPKTLLCANDDVCEGKIRAEAESADSSRLCADSPTLSWTRHRLGAEVCIKRHLPRSRILAGRGLRPCMRLR